MKNLCQTGLTGLRGFFSQLPEEAVKAQYSQRKKRHEDIILSIL